MQTLNHIYHYLPLILLVVVIIQQLVISGMGGKIDDFFHGINAHDIGQRNLKNMHDRVKAVEDKLLEKGNDEIRKMLGKN